MNERVPLKTESVEPAAECLRENAVRAREIVTGCLRTRLLERPEAMASLRARLAPSMTQRGFPRSRAFARMVEEASVAAVCGLAFACIARDRGLIDRQLAPAALLARALNPENTRPAGNGRSDENGPGEGGGPGREGGPDDGAFLWRELKTALGSLARGGTSPGHGKTLHFSALLHDLPDEIELSDSALREALRFIRCGLGRRAPVAIRSLGDIYEALIGGSLRRKASGLYYTPDEIVQYIVSGALGRLLSRNDDHSTRAKEPLSASSILNVRVLDPASGSGHFLLASAEYLAGACVDALAREEKMGDGDRERARALDRYRKLVAARCIYGVDLDHVAVELAGLSLWLFASDPTTPLSVTAGHLRCGNSLHGFCWTDEFPDAARGFDAVIGNPPYVSFSGRQKPRGNEWIKQLDPEGRPGGWQTMHGLFMLKSMELAAESGLVSMVVPDQVGHLKGYGALRLRMLEQGRLLEVRYWGEGVFAGVTSPALTFIVRKRDRVSDDDSDAARAETVVISRDGESAEFSPGPGQEWFTSPSRKVLRRMSAVHTVIKEFSDPGVHTGNVARKLVLARPTGGSVPILEGRQIHPFGCENPRRWLNLSYRPVGEEYFRVSAEDVYQSTDIILRQTAARPVAARHVFRCHFRNSILALKVPEGFSIEYLLGILNSAAAGFLYRASSFESGQRAFPQIKVGLLRSLPIPDPRLRENTSRAGEVEELVRRIEDGAEHDGASPGLMTRLDTLAWSLYGLSGSRPAGRSAI